MRPFFISDHPPSLLGYAISAGELYGHRMYGSRLLYLLGARSSVPRSLTPQVGEIILKFLISGGDWISSKETVAAEVLRR